MNNPNVEQFKRDMMSYNFHKTKMEEIKLSVQEIEYRMSGAGCIPIDRIAPTVSPSQRSNIELIERKDVLISQYNSHRICCDYVDQHLKLADVLDKDMLTDKYINRETNSSLEQKYGYTIRAINKRCNKIIDSIM